MQLQQVLNLLLTNELFLNIWLYKIFKVMNNKF